MGSAPLIGRRQECAHIEITEPRRRRADADRLVRELRAESLVRLGVHGDRRYSELLAGPDDPERDFLRDLAIKIS